MALGLYQSSQNNEVVHVCLDSENMYKISIEAFKEIGTCRKTIKVSRIKLKEGFLFNESLFFEVNLFREV